MALKGSATIELTNADGSKEFIKHDNMITGAINDLCVSHRGEMATMLKLASNNDYFAKHIFGGLLLFNERLDESSDDYGIPTSKITGYASQDAYSGLDLARGTLNQPESGVQDDGSYKFVWDFGTSYANGQIKSLALCPNSMGQIGASDTIVASEKKDFYITPSPVSPFHTYGRMLTDSGTVNGVSTYYYNIVAIVGDYAYAVDWQNIVYNSSNKDRSIISNGNILYLHKFKLGTESISLLDCAGRARYMETMDIQLPESLIEVISSSYDTYSVSFHYNHRDNKLIVFPCQLKADVASNATVPYIDIDLSNDMTVTSHSFTNTTNGVISYKSVGCVSDYDSSCSLAVLDDHIIVVSGDSGTKKMYIIQRKDSAQVIKVTFAGSDLVLNKACEWFKPMFVNSNIVVLATCGLNTSNENVYIVDLSTGIAKMTNAKQMDAKANVIISNKALNVRTGAYLEYRAVLNPFILTTKNNLDQPITKTASQTMKITYTLSDMIESGV